MRIDDSIDTIILVGDYGSGKTEVAVNLSLGLVQGDRPVALADLDLVNPYFRSREVHEPLEQAGVQVVMPKGGHQFADLPILLPSVKGLLQNKELLSVLDVGGDEVGSRVLAGLAPVFSKERHAFWFVLNANRPFNDTVDGCIKTIRRIEKSSDLKVSGVVSNTHLMDETDSQMILAGLELAQKTARQLELAVKFVAVMEEFAEEITTPDVPLLKMTRIMVPPWKRRDMGDVALTRLGAG